MQVEGQRIPNTTHPSVPIGGEENATVLACVGQQRGFEGFQPADHVKLAEALDMVDFDAGGCGLNVWMWVCVSVMLIDFDAGLGMVDFDAEGSGRGCEACWSALMHGLHVWTWVCEHLRKRLKRGKRKVAVGLLLAS